MNNSLGNLAKVFSMIVNAEGPISIETAKRRVLSAWDTRKGNRIDDYLDQAIASAGHQNMLTIKEKFLWPMGMDTPPLRIHVTGEKLRDIDEIAPEETMVAVRTCVQHALGIFHEDLIRETLKLFGLTATRENSVFLRKMISQMVSQNVLNLENGKISKGNNF